MKLGRTLALLALLMAWDVACADEYGAGEEFSSGEFMTDDTVYSREPKYEESPTYQFHERKSSEREHAQFAEAEPQQDMPADEPKPVVAHHEKKSIARHPVKVAHDKVKPAMPAAAGFQPAIKSYADEIARPARQVKTKVAAAVPRKAVTVKAGKLAKFQPVIKPYAPDAVKAANSSDKSELAKAISAATDKTAKAKLSDKKKVVSAAIHGHMLAMNNRHLNAVSAVMIDKSSLVDMQAAEAFNLASAYSSEGRITNPGVHAYTSKDAERAAPVVTEPLPAVQSVKLEAALHHPADESLRDALENLAVKENHTPDADPVSLAVIVTESLSDSISQARYKLNAAAAADEKPAVIVDEHIAQPLQQAATKLAVRDNAAKTQEIPTIDPVAEADAAKKTALDQAVKQAKTELVAAKVDSANDIDAVNAVNNPTGIKMSPADIGEAKEEAVKVVTGDLKKNEFYIFAENDPIPEKLVATPGTEMAVLGGDSETAARHLTSFRQAAKDAATKIFAQQQVARRQFAQALAEDMKLKQWRDARSQQIAVAFERPVKPEAVVLPVIKGSLDSLYQISDESVKAAVTPQKSSSARAEKHDTEEVAARINAAVQGRHVKEALLEKNHLDVLPQLPEFTPSTPVKAVVAKAKTKDVSPKKLASVKAKTKNVSPKKLANVKAKVKPVARNNKVSAASRKKVTADKNKSRASRVKLADASKVKKT